jgi:uncharacterized protein
MKLNLSPVIDAEGSILPINTAIMLEGRDLPGAVLPFMHPVVVIGEIRNTAGATEIQLHAQTTLALSCDRCGKQFDRIYEVRIKQDVARSLNDPTRDDILVLESGWLDISDLVYEHIVLSFPMKLLCSDDCKGLCQGCGADLNLAPCRCKPDLT